MVVAELNSTSGAMFLQSGGSAEGVVICPHLGHP
jgi:hypothetical protein